MAAIEGTRPENIAIWIWTAFGKEKYNTVRNTFDNLFDQTVFAL